MADARGCVYFDTRAWPPGHAAWRELQDAGDRCGLVAFNAPFDGAWLCLFTQGRVPNLVGDTHTEFRLLANEGYPGQSWSLETAMATVLGQPSNQKQWLEAALVQHALVTPKGHPDKSQMWRLAELEPVQFGHYCAMDAEASYWLADVFAPQIAAHPGLAQYVRDEWPNCIRLLVEQNYRGIALDLLGLHALADQLRADIVTTTAAVREHPEVAPHVAVWEADAARDFYAPRVTVKRVRPTVAEFQAGLGPEWQFEPSSAKSLRKFERDAGGFWYREIRTEHPRNQDKPAPKFNWDSPDQMRWLFYERLYRWERLDKKYFRVYLHDGRSVDVPATKGGQLPTGKDVLPALGTLGNLLNDLAKLTKLLEYVEAYIAAAQATGGLHPVLKAPGTLTGRLSGDRGINVQQLPKRKELLQCFRASPGCVLVDLDIASLEPNVLAFFSRDPTYMELFCSGRKHDVYLYMAQKIRKEWADAIGPAYATDLDTAKTQFKRERDLAKTIHLAAGYNAGPRKLYQGMRMRGEVITLEEVTDMHRAYWDNLRKVKEFGRGLEAEREDRGGWIYNGRGRPLCITDDKLKDCTNSFIQSTGHDLFLTYLWYIQKLRVERGVSMWPWNVNVHDATTWEAPADQADAARQVLVDALQLLNDELKADVKLGGSAEIGLTAWDFKKK